MIQHPIYKFLVTWYPMGEVLTVSLVSVVLSPGQNNSPSLVCSQQKLELYQSRKDEKLSQL